MKLKILLTDADSQRTWDAIEKATKAVDSWPAWKRGDDVPPPPPSSEPAPTIAAAPKPKAT